MASEAALTKVASSAIAIALLVVVFSSLYLTNKSINTLAEVSKTNARVMAEACNATERITALEIELDDVSFRLALVEAEALQDELRK